MAKAERSVVIEAPPDEVLAVIEDYEKYPQFLPEVKKVSVASGPAGAKDVTYTIDIKAKLITYTLRHTARPPSELSWTMVRGEMMKGNDGAWVLKPVSSGTEATYKIDLRLGALVPSMVERMLAEQQLPGLLQNFKKRIESLHPRTA
ncbi:MAG TPA: SRPBCC family protein [Myxococcales bacterium]|jgi:ribosome-associated toxin RatA of RatAB toxin-antitoxin module|nr:SRPBCC family protein [Myxococcales bacterium]